MSPDEKESHLLMAYALESMGSLEGAVNHYSEAMASKGPANLHRLTRPLVRVPAGVDPLTCFCPCAAFPQRLAPHCTTTLYNLANAYHDLNQLDQAAANYRRVLELDRANVDAHFNLGVVLQVLPAVVFAQPPVHASFLGRDR